MVGATGLTPRPCPAILLIAFNRPKELEQVFSVLKDLKPPRLYVAVDGPRPGRTEDVETVAAVQALVDRVKKDFPKVETKFQRDNLGCRMGPVRALQWFFTHEEEGVILEDDCVPEPSFFSYQAELLERFRHDHRVLCIAGNNPLSTRSGNESYFFSRFPVIWGWGAWRRSLEGIDWSLQDWEGKGGLAFWRRRLKPIQLFDYWKDQFDLIRYKNLDAWDIQFVHRAFATGALCAVPSRNLVRNIGFGESATHTKDGKDLRANQQTFALEGPLQHPQEVGPDKAWDRRWARQHFWNRHATWRGRFWQFLRRIKQKWAP